MSKASRLREKSEIVKLVKNLDKKMTDFETAVEDIKIFKDTLVDLEEEVTNKTIENQSRLKRLREELEDNKLKVLHESAESIGKVLISTEDLEELNQEIEKTKTQYKKSLAEAEANVDTRVKEQVERRMKILTLENECKSAQLKAQNENYVREITNMKESFTRMENELKSQKELTANIAQANRPSHVNRRETEN